MINITNRNAQIAITSLLVQSTSTSAYGCPKNALCEEIDERVTLPELIGRSQPAARHALSVGH